MFLNRALVLKLIYLLFIPVFQTQNTQQMRKIFLLLLVACFSVAFSVSAQEMIRKSKEEVIARKGNNYTLKQTDNKLFQYLVYETEGKVEMYFFDRNNKCVAYKKEISASEKTTFVNHFTRSFSGGAGYWYDSGSEIFWNIEEKRRDGKTMVAAYSEAKFFIQE